MKQVLVTGASGYVAWHLAKRLQEQKCIVHAIVRPGTNLKRLYALPQKPVLHEHDGTTKNMLRIFTKAAPETVFHLASLSLVDHTPDILDSMLQSNVVLGTQLAEACYRSKTPRFINTGTHWQHFENKTYSPVCLYAATKQAFEDILLYYADTTPLRTVTLVPFEVYGPDDPRGRILVRLQEAQRTGKPITLSPGRQLADFIFIDDMVDAFLHAERTLETSASRIHGGHYAVRSGDPVTIRQLVAAYERITQKDVPVEWGGRPYRPREMMSPWNGELLPGWKARVSLEEGLHRAAGILMMSQKASLDK